MAFTSSGLIDQKWLTGFSKACMVAIGALAVFFLAALNWKKFVLTVFMAIPIAFFVVQREGIIPGKFVAFFAAVMLFDSFCVVFGFFVVPWLDDFCHALTAFALVPCCSYWIFRPVQVFMKNKIRFALAGVCVAGAIGALWEIFEFMISVKAGYVDTISDLAWDFAGGALGALWAVNGLRNDSV